MSPTVEIIADVPYGEGPVWCDDGTLVACNTGAGEIWRIWPEERRAARVATVGGGANGATPASGGGFVVCQNGGLDFAQFGFRDPPPLRRVEPGLQLVAPDASVRYLARGPFQAPNDLVVAADGTLYFTDPPALEARLVDGRPQPLLPRIPSGRVWKVDPGGRLTLFAEGLVFPNGIGLDCDGDVVIVEQQGLMRLHPDGRREWVVENLGPGGGDGLCVDAEGNFYVAGTLGHVIRVIDAGGRILDEWPTPGPPHFPTNVCFGGADLRTLYVTEMPGRTLRWRNCPRPGRPVHPWPVVEIRT